MDGLGCIEVNREVYLDFDREQVQLLYITSQCGVFQKGGGGLL